MSKNNNILVFGLGSDILTDDGIGVKIVNDLSNDPYFSHLQYETTLLFSLDLIDSIFEYKTIIFIDATFNKRSQPGEIVLCELDRFRETLHLSNVHEVRFKDALKFWKNIGYEIPEQIFIISVEVKDYLSFGDDLSPELRASYNEILNQVKSWIHHISINARTRNFSKFLVG